MEVDAVLFVKSAHKRAEILAEHARHGDLLGRHDVYFESSGNE
jgi:hypothetical protein